MKEQFVSYETALKLKELGFDDDCFAYKLGENSPISFCLMCGIDTNYLKNSKIEIEGAVCLPLWQQVLDWFRVKYDIHVVITVNPYSSSSDEIYGYKIYLGPELRCKVNHEEEKQLYYVATSMAALEVLEIISNEYLLKNQL